ncbi:MAG: alcohol dehydrogenase catalytic domain-containing protein [Chloroflexi bacterium]|nr:alcohol dehydrogenase catalytic domain-containing protein [Chloroflexota bacterium]MBV9546297.1 alcohol dehydrogenase catalytic domain-containing protein [Chloroflexota bacterium]
MNLVDAAGQEWPTPGQGDIEVAIAVGGICGSDLHYVHDGGVADFKLREPMTLGHEIVGRISRVGSRSLQLHSVGGPGF